MTAVTDDEPYRCATCQALCSPSEVCSECGNKGRVDAHMEQTRRASLMQASDEEIDRMMGGRGEPDRSRKEQIA